MRNFPSASTEKDVEPFSKTSVEFGSIRIVGLKYLSKFSFKSSALITLGATELAVSAFNECFENSATFAYR